MEKGKHTYRLEAVSHSKFVGQMNLYLCIASFDRPAPKATSVLYHNAKPATPGQTTVIETTAPADYVTIAIYIVPQSYPDSPMVVDSPDFPLEYRVLRDGAEIDVQTLKVNRWGGMQLINVRYE